LTTALKQVSAVIERIPVNIVKASAEYALLTDAAREGGARRAAVGTMVILADEARECDIQGYGMSADVLVDPLASWIVPLAAAIYDGNSAIVSVCSLHRLDQHR
jgi:hypothetical protein